MLILKLLITPALMGLASWVSRRWGPAVGGWFAALPLTSGPVLLVLSIERGPRFAAEAGTGALLALTSLAGFGLAYGWSARRLAWPVSSLAGCGAYLAITWMWQFFSLSLSWTCFVVCCTLVGALCALPIDVPVQQRAAPPRWDIPVRMALAAIFVVTLTSSAARLGPRISGLLTPFPIVATILAAFTHAHHGAAAVGRLLRGLILGLFSFAVFMLVVVVAVERRGIAGAFVTATLTTFAFHAGTHRWTDSLASTSARPRKASEESSGTLHQRRVAQRETP